MEKVNIKLTIEETQLVLKMLRRAEQDIADTCYTSSGYELQEKLARISQISGIQTKMLKADVK
jgi:hypothetical protein